MAGVPVVLVVGLVVTLLRFANAAGGNILLSPVTGPATGGTVVTMIADPSGNQWSNQYIDIPYTGAPTTFTAPVAGNYKLEGWGGEGGFTAPAVGGKGGYTTVTYTMTASQLINVIVGGAGVSGTGAAAAGYNGGGAGGNAASFGGGGATHFATQAGGNALLPTYLSNNNTRQNLLLVAGGGGGGMIGAAGCPGGAGGGLAGTNGDRCTSGGGSGNADPGGGTYTAGGAGGQNGAAGVAGQGAAVSQAGGSLYGGGGGGGYWGGGSGSGRGGSGGGGSGYYPGISTPAIAGAPAVTAGSSVNGTIANGMPNPAAPIGTMMTGRAGNGHARITILQNGLYYRPTVNFGGQMITPSNWCNYNASNPECTSGTPNSVTFVTPARGVLPADVNVFLDFDPTTSGTFHYYTPATNFTYACSVDGGSTWGTTNRFINPGAGTGSGYAQCRIVLNGAYSGTISLADNFFTASSAGLAGTFSRASNNDSRFDPSTNTWTLDYTDTYDSTGQTLYFNYNTPAWGDTSTSGTLLYYWTSANQNDLMRPRIDFSVTPGPAFTAPAPVLGGSNFQFHIYAQSYRINPPARFNENIISNLSITTYGALYNGSITMTENLANSDNPAGLTGIFNPTGGYPVDTTSSPIVNFANGADSAFRYAPRTTSSSPNYTALCGTNTSLSGSCVNINVAPESMRITGPTELARSESGEYILTIFIDGFTTVLLEDHFDGTNTLAGGIFTDTSASNGYPSGTFNSSTNTYTVSGCNTGTLGTNACVRTFTYEVGGGLPDDAAYITIDAESDTNESTFIDIDVIADALNFSCPIGEICTIGYVGTPQSYNVRPNGVFTGSVAFSIGDALGLLSPNPIAWSNNNNNNSLSYTPGTPGRYTISAAVTSAQPTMSGANFNSKDNGLNDYIWVIANETSFFTGDDSIPNGGYGTYTLALNGPFVGTVILGDTDTVNDVPQGGTFLPSSQCVFTFADYNPVTNTTACTFTYTPTVEAEDRYITLAPSFPPELGDYINSIVINPITIRAFGFPKIETISPFEGPSSGGEAVFFTGEGLLGLSYITFDGIPCQNLNIISDTQARCIAPAHPTGTVDVLANNIVPDWIYETDGSGELVLDDQGYPIIIGGGPLQYTYFDVATDYINECDETGLGDWTTTPYVTPGTVVDCRIVLNGRWQGAVSLSDDYWETIDPGLSGTFASADSRFVGSGNFFGLTFDNTADVAEQTLEYTYQSPSWSTLLNTYWTPENQDNVWWPLIQVEVDDDTGGFITSSEDDVVFGLLAQSYTITTDGSYDFFCIDCEVDFIVSTYGAPYEGTISVADILTNSDNSSGTHGTFWAGGVPDNPGVIDFTSTDGADNGFSYIPQTTATPTTTLPTPPDKYIALCGTSSSPAIADTCLNIAPVKDPGIFIIPWDGFSFLNRGQTGTYTLIVNPPYPGWSGTITLDDVFNADGSAGNGVFADVSGTSASGSGGNPDDGNPSGTFNSGTNTYTFSSSGDTYERTFEYTLRNSAVTPPPFPGHILQLTAVMNSPDNQTFTNIFVNATTLTINCALTNANCPPNTSNPIGYVGRLQDYTFSPNGAWMGAANVSVDDVGFIGTLTWSTISATTQTMSYTPRTPGRHTISATVTSSNVPVMVGQTFTSTGPVPHEVPTFYDPRNLNDYIWVMANQMSISGPNYLKYAAAGNFTLTMNGPFIGTIDFDDDSMGGAFSPAASCTFSLSDYDPVTNTTSCSFDYTPALSDDIQWIYLTPSISGYSGPMSASNIQVIVYGRPLITAIDPDSGPTAGGNIVTLTGDNLATVGNTLNIDRIIVGNIEVNLATDVTIVDLDNIELTMPPNAAGPVDIVVIAGARTYHHPDIYTYIPSITNISPNLGPTTGGTGFGSSYNSNGTVTITGVDITNAPRYADGSGTQYFGLGWLEFTGSQYIDTGTNQLGNTNLTLDATWNSGQYIAGNVVAPNDYFLVSLNNVAGTMFANANYGNYSASAGSGVAPGDRVKAILDADGTTASFSVSLNGASPSTNGLTPTNPPSTPYNIYLGSANNAAGSTTAMTGRIYSASITKDSSADSRNLVPVCTMDGLTGGMFDTINDVFYPSASATQFGCNKASVTPPTVTFGGTAATNVTVVDLNTIVVVPPPHSPGVVDVKVIVNTIPLTLSSAYIYRQPLTVETIFPFIGDISGGDEVTITGVNFDPTNVSPSITVTFDIDGTPGTCTSPTLVDNETITCDTPARAAAGLVSVTVSNGTETYTMQAVVDPNGNGVYPTQDGLGRSTGGFLYADDVYIELEASTASVDLNVSISTPFDSDYATLSVITNNATGYDLYMQSGGSTLVCTSNGSLTIPSTVLNTVSAGSWAYQVGNSPTSNGWAAAPTSPTLIDYSNSPTFVSPPETPRDTRVNYAVREGSPTYISRACSLYEQTVTYSAYTK